jgi:hypothetical protein
MPNRDGSTKDQDSLSRSLYYLIPLATAVVYYFSNPKPQNYYDYTFRVAENLLHGSIGFATKPPDWLNEFVPFGGSYYSVFPLGSILSMLPFAALKAIGMIPAMPGAFIAAILAGAACLCLLKIADSYDLSRGKKVLLTVAILFGTWAWTNLTFAGAWQLALGFAMLGELGAIYYSVFERRPFLAGVFFALAFGNRTEIILTAPVFFYLLARGCKKRHDDSKNDRNALIVDLAWFCAIPFLLGVLTLFYNYLRFDSFIDFGYARIPGVLNEPWYDHGIFSIHYIPRQAWEMLAKMWNLKDTFPYLIPDGFSSSILFSSPFLFLVLRFGSRDKVLKYACWAAIIVQTFLLWIHGNSGGWQFGYRYASVLLPWIFLILLESSPKKITPLEWAAYAFSFAMNIYAMWLFNWTEYVKP